MSETTTTRGGPGASFDAEWYDRSINWAARFEREIPLLIDVFGPPGEGGLLDAGCGTGRQASELAQHGYRVVGADASEEMLTLARSRSEPDAPSPRFVLAPYAKMHETVGGGFDGIYCLGNALAAAGSRDAVAEAIEQFSRCLRVGGRLFVQVLNFPLMREETPCIRGPRVSRVGEREYISIRQFHFDGATVQVTNVTLWNDDGWKKRVHGGVLHPIERTELHTLCRESGLRVDDTWGNYARDEFDPDRSVDLLIVATRA